MRCEQFRRWAGRDQTQAPHSSASPALSAPAPLRTPESTVSNARLANQIPPSGGRIPSQQPGQVKRVGTHPGPSERMTRSAFCGLNPNRPAATHAVKHWLGYRRLLYRYPNDCAVCQRLRHSAATAGAHTSPRASWCAVQDRRSPLRTGCSSASSLIQ